MGVVYEAFDQERNCAVALKTLRTREPRALLRLKNEFRALRDLQHPNLVSFGELFEWRGDWFFTMELLRGFDFLSWVRRGPADGSDGAQDRAPTATVAGSPNSLARDFRTVDAPLVAVSWDEQRLRDGLRQLAHGLGALHAANKIHRDIKPSNILVTSDPRLVILDFGLVSDALHGSGDDEVAGTYVFMAPEQTTPNPVGPAADWYAVGVLLYLALSGRPPIVGPRDVLFELKRTFEPPPPSRLGAKVPADLDALCADLLRIDPAARPDAAEVLRRLGGEPARAPEPAPAVRETPFVGRQAELRELEHAFADSRKGRAVTVLVHGESGVGKSTLARRFIDQIGALPDAVVLTGRCYERESVPYKAIDEVVDGLSRHLRRLPEVEAASLLPRRASLLTNVFPVLLDVEVFAKAPRMQDEVADPHELRARVFAALRELLTRLGDRHAVMLVIDDLQWADADSVALLAEVLRPPMPPTVFLLATVRTASEPSVTQRNRLDDWLPLLGDVRHVWLQNLPPSEARQLVSLLAPVPESQPPLNADSIADESEGHPLFIDALVRHRLSHGETTSALRLEEALWERVLHLPPEPRRLLEVVAVAGRPLPQSVVARGSVLEPAEFSSAAAHLRLANFVRTDGVRSTDSIEPYHDKVRSAVRGNLTPARLAECNQRLALALEAAGGGDPEALSVYWQGAGYLERAANYAITAAARAAKALAFDQAARLYRSALDLHPVEGAQGCEIRTRLAEALAHAGRGAEAAQVFRAAAALAGPAEQLELKRRAGEQLLLSGHVDEGLTEVETVLAAAGLKLARTPQRALISLLYHRARLRLRGTRFEEHDVADLPPRLLKVIDLSFSVAQGLIWVDVLRGAAFQSRLIRLALDAGEPYRLSRALALEAGFASTSGRSDAHQRAAELLSTAEALARKTGEPQALAIVLAAAGFAAIARQDYPSCRELMLQAETILVERCVGAFWELALTRTNLLFAIGLVGDLPDLASRGPRYVRAAQDRGDLLAATSMICGPLSLVAFRDDEPERARSTCEEAMSKWSQRGFHLQHLYALSTQVQVDLYEGKPEDAHRRMLEAWPDLERASFLRLLVTRAWMRDLRARAAAQLAAKSKGSDRDRLLAEAAKLARSLHKEQLPGTVAQAAGTRAAVALHRGDRPKAIAELEESARLFDVAHMPVQAASARLLRARLDGSDASPFERDLAGRGVRRPDRLASTLSACFVD